MSTISIRDQRLAGATMLPDDFIDYYMPRANGDFVKIYLFLLRSVHAQTPAPTISSLADVFRLTERDVDRALRYWQDAGLLDLKYKGEELDEITLLPVSQKLHEMQKDPVTGVMSRKIITDDEIPAGQSFWYYRKGTTPFTLTIEVDKVD